jgi:hypothetical protein
MRLRSATEKYSRASGAARSRRSRATGPAARAFLSAALSRAARTGLSR